MDLVLKVPALWLLIILLLLLYALSSIKILAEYERAVIFTLGRLRPAPKGPG